MKNQKKKLVHLLDQLAEKQKAITKCHDYYQVLEKEFDHRRDHLTNSEDCFTLTQSIETLNREYEKKVDVMYEELNVVLVQGYDLAQTIGAEIAHDFKILWDYMTGSFRHEVKLERVLKEIEHLKNGLF